MWRRWGSIASHSTQQDEEQPQWLCSIRVMWDHHKYSCHYLSRSQGWRGCWRVSPRACRCCCRSQHSILSQKRSHRHHNHWHWYCWRQNWTCCWNWKPSWPQTSTLPETPSACPRMCRYRTWEHSERHSWTASCWMCWQRSSCQVESPNWEDRHTWARCSPKKHGSQCWWRHDTLSTLWFLCCPRKRNLSHWSLYR